MFVPRCLAVCLLLMMVGCSGESYPLSPVSGVVTLDDQPLPDARVAFQPRCSGEEEVNSGPGSYAKTDSQGRYQLETIDGKPGAVVTTHDVTISTFQIKADRTRDEESAEVASSEKVPSRYFEPGALDYTVTPQGTDSADFSLETRQTPTD